MITDAESLTMLTKYVASETYSLRAFTNNFTPTRTDTSGSFTEADGGGYAAITLTGASATVAALSGVPSAYWSTQTWNFSGALTGTATIYGVYILRGSAVVGSYRLPVAYQPAASGVLNVVPVIALADTSAV